MLLQHFPKVKTISPEIAFAHQIKKQANCGVKDAKHSIVALPWDSKLFGFSVGRIPYADIDDIALRACLQSAKDAAFSLVYWMTRSGRVPEPSLLNAYNGRLADRKMAYANVNIAEIPPTPMKPAVFRIEEYPCKPALAEMKSLAVQSGEFSRFRADDRFPTNAFINLYETWVDRSTKREIADLTLTAINNKNKIVGLITAAIAGEEGEIGLLGVDVAFRRHGVATALMNACHRWMTANKLKSASVVTQGDNIAACRFYEKCGYRVRNKNNVFHFWP